MAPGARTITEPARDADVAHRAGAPTVKTPPEEMQAASVMFHLSGVDKRAFLEGVGQGAGLAAALSLRGGRDLHDLDLGLVQAELARQGVRYR